MQTFSMIMAGSLLPRSGRHENHHIFPQPTNNFTFPPSPKHDPRQWKLFAPGIVCCLIVGLGLPMRSCRQWCGSGSELNSRKYQIFENYFSHKNYNAPQNWRIMLCMSYLLMCVKQKPNFLFKNMILWWLLSILMQVSHDFGWFWLILADFGWFWLSGFISLAAGRGRYYPGLYTRLRIRKGWGQGWFLFKKIVFNAEIMYV